MMFWSKGGIAREYHELKVILHAYLPSLVNAGDSSKNFILPCCRGWPTKIRLSRFERGLPVTLYRLGNSVINNNISNHLLAPVDRSD